MNEVTVLQDVAESVAAEVIGLTKPDVRQAVESGGGIAGFDPFTFLAFIEAIMAMISQLMENCPQTDASLRDVIKEPNIWQRVQVRRTVQKYASEEFGSRWRRKANRVTDAMLKVGASSSDQVIDAVVDQCRNASY